MNPILNGKVNCVSALRNISLLKKFEAKLVTSTPKFVYLFFFWVFFLNIGRSVTGLFVVAKGLLFMTSQFFLSMFFFPFSFSMMFFCDTDVSRSFRVHIYYGDVFTSIFPFYYCRSRVPHINPSSLPFDLVGCRLRGSAAQQAWSALTFYLAHRAAR